MNNTERPFNSGDISISRTTDCCNEAIHLISRTLESANIDLEERHKSWLNAAIREIQEVKAYLSGDKYAQEMLFRKLHAATTVRELEDGTLLKVYLGAKIKYKIGKYDTNISEYSDDEFETRIGEVKYVDSVNGLVTVETSDKIYDSSEALTSRTWAIPYSNYTREINVKFDNILEVEY